MSGENGISIIRRLIETGQGNLSPATAQAVLEMDFAPSDQLRMGELAARSNRGELSAEEAEEYDGYIEAADLLSLWQSKARLSLKRYAAQV